MSCLAVGRRGSQCSEPASASGAVNMQGLRQAWFRYVLLVAATGGPAMAATAAVGEQWQILAASLVGRPGDSVVAVAIQSDGSLVLAANVSGGPLVPGEPARDKPSGRLLRLSADGRKLLASVALPGDAADMAIDGTDNIYLATSAGALKLDPQGSKVLWRFDVGGPCSRIDVAVDGHCAALRYDNPEQDTVTGAGTIFVIDPQGKQLGQFRGHHNTCDVCVDGASKTVVHIGWRQASAHDGKKRQPVQIAYVRGCSYSGQVKYTLYDWSADPDVPEFINRPTNNMADTRGYRCSIGRDGLLYCAFECAGGNHIFRYHPRLVDGQWLAVGQLLPKADQYHGFHNSRAEHKALFARFEPASGRLLLEQQFCGRLENGRANAVRVKGGAVAADEDGCLLLGGAAPAGLPLSLLPPETGSYTGGSYLLVMSSDFRQRLLCTRFQAGGTTHALDARRVGTTMRVLVGGKASSKPEDGFCAQHPIQPQGEPGSGFFALLAR